MEKICKGWNKSKGCKCEYRAKGESDFCGIHKQFDGDTCSICLEDVTSKGSSRKLKCGHMFHNKCVSQWLNSGNENAHCCPLCRKPWRTPKVIFFDTPPEWMWDVIVQGPGRPSRDILADMDPINPPPLIFENVTSDGETFAITMTMELWEQLVEPN